MTEPSFLDAATLVGLLADDDRRQVFAALALHETSVAGITRATGLDPERAARALGTLVGAGLVERADDGELQLLGRAFAVAARAAARPAAGPGVDGPPEVVRVLRAFVRDGRLVSIPAQRAKRLVVLDRLAQEFEPGRRYSEAMVNLVLGRWHPDTAALRRYLVDEGFLDREAGEYWRTGGTVEV